MTEWLSVQKDTQGTLVYIETLLFAQPFKNDINILFWLRYILDIYNALYNFGTFKFMNLQLKIQKSDLIRPFHQLKRKSCTENLKVFFSVGILFWNSQRNTSTQNMFLIGMAVTLTERRTHRTHCLRGLW